MAQFNTYRCCCGFEIQTDPLGHYSIMSGEYYTLCCHKCNDIAKAGYNLTCPECGYDQHESWSVNSKCPKCNCCGSFIRLHNSTIMVD